MTDRVKKVLEIFNDYFGEDRVDCQAEDSNSYYIIVYYSNVRVTNEYGKYIDINDVYLRTKVSGDGSMQGYFEILRTTFTALQASAQYVHSHAPYGCIGRWTTMCLGSGPIRDTIAMLLRGFDETSWLIYCRELDQYIHVESLTGGPYMRLESLGNRGNISSFLEYVNHKLYGWSNGLPSFRHYFACSDDIVKRLLASKELKFNYVDGLYKIGNSEYDFSALVANCVRDILSENSTSVHRPNLERYYLPEYIISNRQFYLRESRSRAVNFEEDFVGQVALTFKGVEKRYNLLGPSTASMSEEHIVRSLNVEDTARIYVCITILVNSIYGSKSNNNNQRFRII